MVKIFAIMETGAVRKPPTAAGMIGSMIGRMHHVVLDCPDPAALAAFYSALLGLSVTYDDGDWAVAAVSDTSSGLAFQRAPGNPPPTWPDPAVPQQFHLDVMVDDVAAAGPRVLALGARKLDGDNVYADPAGHPFCLIPRPRWAPPVTGENGGLRRMRTPLPPVAAVIGFIDAINRGDVDRLVALMSPDHRLQVLHEPPLVGREANRAAWHGYVTAFPDYVIYPERFVHRGDEVLVLGSTTGSHLGLPDQEERELTVIWHATVRDGLLVLWQVIEDTPGQRAFLGLTDD
jgi:catechol 2,3-dioxygenase-like lactoylglutathione lyase family enzyme